jgi:hypothetical protein
VSCLSARARTSVGSYINTWAIQQTPSQMPELGPSLTAVSCTSAASCTAAGVVGQFGTSSIHLTMAEAWDGQSWPQSRSHSRTSPPIPPETARDPSALIATAFTWLSWPARANDGSASAGTGENRHA